MLDQLIANWNATAAAFPSDQCLHQLVEQQVVKTPHSIALVYENRTLTYEQLNQKANQLAHYLQQLNVSTEALIGISFERSFELIIGVLAILKAGGAYLPLDPSYPAERLQFMLADAQPKILLTQSHLTELFIDYAGTLVRLDTDWDEIANNPTFNPSNTTIPEQLAYVIYTSGSTGKPKGVMIEHRSACNLAYHLAKLFDINVNTHLLQFASFSFDAAVAEWVTTLTSGGILYLMPLPQHVASTDILLEIFKTYSINIVILPPSILNILPAESLSAVQTLIVAGEPCTQTIVDRWSKRVKLINAYGPTEATVCASTFICNTAYPAATIGRPIPNTEIYILNEKLIPVPIGTIGELYIGGVGLARGYLNRPELAQQKFISHPFNNKSPDARLYKTGDLGRYLPDGNIEYLGRQDEQVKINGFRVELKEIETVLSKHINVSEVAVIAKEDRASRKYLSAYVVFGDKHSNSIETATHIQQLRHYVSNILPHYMVPSIITRLPALPLNLNGKVDRKALFDLEDKVIPSVVESEQPRNQTEEILIKICSALLPIAEINIHTNLLEVGADSIIFLQLVSRAREAGIYFDVREVFQYLTVAKLAAIARLIKKDIEKPDKLLIDNDKDIPLTPIQKWFFEQSLAEPNYWNQAIILFAKKVIDISCLEQTLRYLLKHHESLRLRFRSLNNNWSQYVSDYEQLLKENQDENICQIINIPGVAAASIDHIIAEYAIQIQQQIDLKTGPLLRAVLFQNKENSEQRLMIIIHHLVIDGVSWRVLIEDLSSIYQQLLDKEKIDLPQKTSSYREWAIKLTHHNYAEIISQELAYWQAIIKKGKEVFPIDFNHGENSQAVAKTITTALNEEETSCLLQKVPQAYKNQINDILLTALLLTANKITGTKELYLLLEGHGREEILSEISVSRTIGWFTTIFPVYLTISDINDMSCIVKSVKEQLRQIPHHGIGYGLLKYLTPNNQSTHCLRQANEPTISFNYFGQWDNSENDLFKFTSEKVKNLIGKKNSRRQLIEVNSEIIQGCLSVSWTYSSNHYSEQTIAAMATLFHSFLIQLINHCTSSKVFGYTPSDFPYSGLQQKELDQFFKQPGIEDIYPLSPMQSGLLFHEIYEENSTNYFVQSIFELKGKLNKEFLKYAWQQVVNCHPIFRTAFAWKSMNQPMQYVLNKVSIPWQEFYWHDLSKEQQDERLDQLLLERRQNGFLLSVAPLLRLDLIFLSDDRAYLVWHQHHILLDGWCRPLIIKQVWQYYEALSLNNTYYLNYSHPYRDYIVWLSKQNISAAETFWKDYLLNCAQTCLSEQIIRPTNFVSQHENYVYKLSVSQTQAITQFIRQHQITLNSLLQGVWSILLSRYLQKVEVTFGVTVSGRNAGLAGVENMVGLFINTLPLRVQVRKDEKVIDFLQQLQQQMLQLQEFSYISLARIQALTHKLNEQPLFDSLFVFENYPEDILYENKALGVQFRIIQNIERTEYPITLLIVPTDELQLQLNYDATRFDENTIHQIIQHFQEILKAFLTDSSSRIGEISLLTASERQQIFNDWNNTKINYPGPQTIHELIEAQVAKTPNRIAIIYENQTLTYAQFNEKSNQLAYYLRKLNIKPEQYVALCCERSFDLLLGLLAILKVGAAYVPLDPSYPHARIRFMLEDVKPSLVLTQVALSALWEGYSGRCVYLDTIWNEVAANPTTDLDNLTKPGHLANIIYTSGSTGKPKGVCITHVGLANRLIWMQQQYHLTSADKVLHKTSIGFDVSGWELLWPLISGAQCVMATPGIHREADKLIQFIQEKQITVIHFVPTMLGSFLSMETAQQCQSLKLVFVSGEALPISLMQAFFKKFSAQLHNLYGPTEASIDVTYWQCQQTAEHILIGRPIANTEIYLLDNDMQPVPIGTKGEIYIGGVGVAKGYLNRPELNQERFIVNPFNNQNDSYLYKTGDLARYLPDGNIEYVGRVDNQIKLRGYRIELGEIENVILSQSIVKEAVVLLREEEQRNYLIAYLISEDGTYQGEVIEKHENKLRLAIKKILPDYMIPSYFIWLPVFPLTMSGKLDRKALPSPNKLLQIKSGNYMAPSNEVERKLTAIWSDLLSAPTIGIYDNFFELGGDSIISIQVVARAMRQGIHLTVRQIFATPTIADLARNIKQPPEYVSATTLDMDTNQPFPITPIQQWFFALNLVNLNHWNLSVLVKAKHALDTEILQQALKLLTQYHPALRLKFKFHDKYWQQQYCVSTEEILYNNISLNKYSEKEKNLAIQSLIKQAQASLNIEEGHLFKVIVFGAGKNDPPYLLLVAHHLIIDGVSWRIVLEDLSDIYHNLSVGRISESRIKTDNYYKWCKTLPDYCSNYLISNELDYWLDVINHKNSYLPTDFNNHSLARHSAKTISVSLSVELTKELLQKTLKNYQVRINDVLLTALMLAVNEVYKFNSLYLHLEGHGREDILTGIDITNTIGWFTTIYPLKIRLPEETEISCILSSIKQQLNSIPHQGIGYGILRYLSSNPKVREHLQSSATICFNYLGQFKQNQENSLFDFISFETVSAIDELNTRVHLLDINAEIINEKLTLHWTFSLNHYQEQTIQKLASCYLEKLNQIIHYISSDKKNVEAKRYNKEINLTDEALSALNHKYGAIENVYPLTPAQTGLVFHALYQHDSPLDDVYFRQTIFTFNGHLNLEVFKQAWQYATDVYPALRSIFINSNEGQTLQLILKDLSLVWEVEHWETLPEELKQNQLKDYLVSDRKKGFNLAIAPLHRYKLIETGEELYFIWSHHHVLFDGWSLALIINMVFNAYQKIINKQPLQLIESSYKNYFKWLQQDTVTSENFWQTYLADVEEPTHLAKACFTFHTEEVDKTHAEFPVLLNQQLSQDMRAFAKSQQITLSTFMQLAWSILVSRYTRQQQIVIGVTVSGRAIEVEGIEETVGLLINTLPVCMRIDNESTLAAMLKALQLEMLELSQYTKIPLAEILAFANKSVDRQLFDHLFVFENYPFHHNLLPTIPELNLINIQTIEKTEYPLTLIILPNETIEIRFHYKPHHFTAAVIGLMADQLQALMANMLTNSQQKLANLSLLSTSQKQVLLDLYTVKNTFPVKGTIQQLFEAQVERTPNAIAVTADNISLSYQVLNKRANQLAHFLRTHNTKPGALIGVCLERSLELIISILGVLKAGGAYVPLDPYFPMERMRFILADAQINLLVTHSTLLESFTGYKGNLIQIDKCQAIINDSIENISNINLPTDIAYIIYTSGSTGQPKGVLTSHYNVIRLFTATQHWFQFNDKDVVTLFHSYAFDFSVWEIWSALFYGGKLIIVPYSTSRSPTDFYRLLIEQRVTVLNQTPSAFNQLLAYEAISNQPHDLNLRYIIFGGEALNPRMLANWFERYGEQQTKLINMYGITETTVHVSYYPLSKKDIKYSASIIGQPILDLAMLILDNSQQLCPVGMIGELYIAGAGLAHGYLNRPSLTAERFVYNFVNKDSINKLYKTGDLARYLPDGNIEYLGRLDFQIKLRGYRIECGEIETAVKAYPKINQTIVLLKGEGEQEKLIVYITCHGELNNPQSLFTALHRHLMQCLPEYMLPSGVVLLDKFPLTSSGKIDKAFLFNQPETAWHSDPYQTPRTPVEANLTAIWQTLLNRELIGIHDNFFNIGGHSLLAMRFVIEIRKLYEIELPLRELFIAPTIAQIAQKLINYENKQSKKISSLNERLSTQTYQEYQLSFAQQRLWYLEKILDIPGLNHINLTWRLEGPLNIDVLKDALVTLVYRHEMLRTIFTDYNGEIVQKILSKDELNFRDQIIFIEESNQERIDKNLLELLLTPFNYNQSPLIRVALYQLQQDVYIFSLILHHLAADGWSIQILLRELSYLYNCLLCDKQHELSPILQYRDFVHWQYNLLQSALFEQQITYWQDKLARADKVLALPTDKLRPAQLSYQAGRYLITLDQITVNQLRQLGGCYQATLYMVILAFWQLLLHQYSGQKDIIVGTPIANRHYAGSENIVGLFINTIALYTRCESDLEFTEFLERVRDTVLEAYEHQDVPFEKLIEHLAIERVWNMHPLFQVMLIFQTLEDSKLNLSELTITDITAPPLFSKFDITLWVREDVNTLNLQFEYATDLFEQSTIIRMAEHFQYLIKNILQEIIHENQPNQFIEFT